MEEAVIVSAVRTAIGNYGETLSRTPAVKLGSIVIKEVLKRAGLRPEIASELLEYGPEQLKDTGPLELEQKYSDWEDTLTGVMIDEVIIGNVIQGGQGQNVARQSAIYAGIPKEVPCFTVNKICASGIKSIALAVQAIKAGDGDIFITGGTENMSSVPYYLPTARWGARMFNTELIDGMVYDGLWEIFYGYHMGMTAENIAAKYGITRKEQDEFALLSHQRAMQAIKNGTFREEIVPVEVKQKKATKMFDTDEHPRESTMEDMAKLKPAFIPDGTVTAGNASGITDAAAALVVMSARKAKELNLKPLATVRGYASSGVDPAFMGLGPVPSTKRALAEAGLTIGDIEVVELNEAFASQSIAVIRELGLDIEKTNLHGSGISLGHPIGCTGARITVTLVHEMVRRNLSLGLATLCIGGGQGMTIILERK